MEVKAIQKQVGSAKKYLKQWVIVTNDKKQLVIAIIPTFLQNQEAIAKGLADAYNNQNKLIIPPNV